MHRGRKSLEEVIAGPIIPGRRPNPPADLSDEERALWTKITAGLPLEYLKPECRPLWKAFIRHSLLSDMIARRINEQRARAASDPAAWAEVERLARELCVQTNALVSSGTKLRAFPASRYSHQQAYVMSEKSSAPQPWSD